MADTPAVEFREVGHNYGNHPALQGVSFQVGQGEIFALLGPNGGGKTTLFRILSTQMQASAGTAFVLGVDVSQNPGVARQHMGVVFQSPSLDKKLTAEENLVHQGHLYGLRGSHLKARMDRALEAVDLFQRRRERVEKFSGGMQRRVEVAKALMHDPDLLLLDEPSTGLDPHARLELWAQLVRQREENGVTSLLTTHLMEEAEKADRVAILHKGRVVALGSPEKLKATVGGEVLELQSNEPKRLQAGIAQKFGGDPVVIASDTVRLETSRADSTPGARLLVDIVEAFPGLVESGRVGKPSLEDVFVRCTGHRFESGPEV
ncbi:MAG: ABC transporter ATP-binding protein [Candidatus Sumerlaeaceae bacterium]